MYCPSGFDCRRSLQLAELTCSAYGQLNAFQKDLPWRPPPGYALVADLRYVEAKGGIKKRIVTHLSHELGGLSANQKGRGLPIGFIAEKGADVYLVFRGTMTPTEWLRDFNVHLTPYPYRSFGKVHDGFLQVYDIFHAAICDALSGIRARGRLFIAGHSLGAALSILAAPDIAAHTPFSTPEIHTFASPRVGDRDFVDAYNKAFTGRSFRIANTSDIVPSMPFPVPFLGFIGGYFTHVDVPVEFTTQLEDVEKNHGIATYVNALKEGAGRGSFLRYFRR